METAVDYWSQVEGHICAYGYGKPYAWSLLQVEILNQSCFPHNMEAYMSKISIF